MNAKPTCAKATAGEESKDEEAGIFMKNHCFGKKKTKCELVALKQEFAIFLSFKKPTVSKR